jgi:hypothetical protein
MKIELKTGTMKISDTLDAWVITSKTATAKNAEDIRLRYGDVVDLTGDVWRNGERIANID